jgi:ABC-type cobalamin/Fe3+-siderophores transport system ATPase subunit
MLKVDHLSTAYGSRRVLQDVSFELPRGLVLGVIGPNGAGKTTLIRALSGVIPLAGGRIEVNGQEIARLREPERARLVAVVPQARNLPPAFTGREMVQLGRTPYVGWTGGLSLRDIQRVHSAMERAGTLELAERRLGDMSGGEQQRLMLARALAQEAPLLLLDEPTTHLDLQHQIHLLSEIRSLAEHDGLTVVMALHDLNLVARYADRVALIADGCLRALGTPREVLDPTLLSEVYHLALHALPGRDSERPIILPTVL